MIQCPRCGYKNADGRALCSVCHTPLQGHLTASPVALPTSSESQGNPKSLQAQVSEESISRTVTKAIHFVSVERVAPPTQEIPVSPFNPASGGAVQGLSARSVEPSKSAALSAASPRNSTQDVTISRPKQASLEEDMDAPEERTYESPPPAPLLAPLAFEGDEATSASAPASAPVILPFSLPPSSPPSLKVAPPSAFDGEEETRTSSQAGPSAFDGEDRTKTKPSAFDSEEATNTAAEASSSSPRSSAPPKESQAMMISSSPEEAPPRISKTGEAAPLKRPLPKPRLEPGFAFAPTVRLPALWRRGMAGSLDLLLVLSFAGGLSFLLGPAPKKAIPQGLHPLDFLAVFLEAYPQTISYALTAFCLVYVAYTGVLHALTGATLGKKLLGLRVVERTGRPIGLFASLLRSLFFLPSFFFGLFGIAWILVDREYRGFHDRVCGSLVVQASSPDPLAS